MLVYPGLRKYISSRIQQLFNTAQFFAPLTHTAIPSRAASGTTATFTRATTKTVMGYAPTANAADGLTLLTVAANEMAFVGARRISEGVWSNTYADGSLIPSSTMLGYSAEGAATNLCLQSKTFENASWTKDQCTISANAVVAPDGTLTADKIVEAATTNVHYIYQPRASAAGTYTHSAYLKKGERDWGTLYMEGFAVSLAYFDLNTGTVGTVSGTGTPSATITSAGNGWYRCTLTATVGLSAPNGIGAATANGTSSYAGDITKGIYVWGAQVELGSSASSYIATTTTAVTRNADVLTYSSAGNILDAAGAVYAEVTSNTVAGQQMDMVDLVGSGNPFIPMLINTGNNFALLDPSISTRAFNASPTRPITTPVKFSSTWSASGTTGTFSGATPPALQTYTTGAVTNPICVGGRADGTQPINGTIRNVRIWQRAISSSELQAVTR